METFMNVEIARKLSFVNIFKSLIDLICIFKILRTYIIPFISKIQKNKTLVGMPILYPNTVYPKSQD